MDLTLWTSVQVAVVCAEPQSFFINFSGSLFFFNDIKCMLKVFLIRYLTYGIQRFTHSNLKQTILLPVLVQVFFNRRQNWTVGWAALVQETINS